MKPSEFNNKIEEIIKLIKMKVSQARELGYSYKDLEYIEQKLKEVKNK